MFLEWRINLLIAFLIAKKKYSTIVIVCPNRRYQNITLININIKYNVCIKNAYFISEKSEHIYFGLDEDWVFCLGKETKNIYKWWIVVLWTTLFYHHIPNKAMIWQIVFHIKRVCNATVLDWDMLCALLYKQKMGAIVHVIVWVGILQ